MKIILRSDYFKYDDLAIDAEGSWGQTNEWHNLLRQLKIDKAKWDDTEEVEIDVLDLEIL